MSGRILLSTRLLVFFVVLTASVHAVYCTGIIRSGTHKTVYQLELTADELFCVTRFDEEVSLTLEVKNIGKMPLHGVQLLTKVPRAWDVQSDCEVIKSIEPQQEMELTLCVTPHPRSDLPKSQQYGEYDIIIGAQTEQRGVHIKAMEKLWRIEVRPKIRIIPQRR